MKTKFKIVRYFYPSGRDTLPDGIYIQKGGFLRECRTNKSNFTFRGDLASERKVLDEEIRRGVIVFPVSFGALLPEVDKVIFAVRKVLATLAEDDYSTFSVDRSFKARYMDVHGNCFDERSLTVRLQGLSGAALLHFAGLLSRKLCQSSVLVRDFHSGKIYLADLIDIAG
ncbi:MAG: hypothetical protein LKG25_04580 [Prevotella sp.]|nr:hypothetical protein [Prevotella sp.]MCI1281851.1 hypothetical protein [Prevotella sp.]